MKITIPIILHMPGGEYGKIEKIKIKISKDEWLSLSPIIRGKLENKIIEAIK